MKTYRHLLIGALSTAALLLFTGTALAQDPVKVAPDNYKVVLENDSVRVFTVNLKAGEKVATHSHPDHIVYATTAGKLKFTHADGKSEEVDVKLGESKWVKAETHGSENIGTAEFKGVVVELKKAPAAGAAPAKMADADDQAKSAPESTKVLVDNDRVRVLDVTLKPGGKLPKHSHPANVNYTLSDCKLKVTTYPEGKTEEKSYTAGTAMWKDPVSHAVENVGTADARVLLVELK